MKGGFVVLNGTERFLMEVTSNLFSNQSLESNEAMRSDFVYSDDQELGVTLGALHSFYGAYST